MVALEVNVATYVVLFALLTLQIYVLLWASGMVNGLKTKAHRLLCGALLGATYDVLVDLAAFGVLGEARFLGSALAVLTISLASFLVAYWPIPRSRLLATLGYYYLLAFLGAGAAYGVQNLTGIGWLGPIAALAATLIAGELGWSIVQHWLWQRVLYVPIAVDFLGSRVEAIALVDTGNSLRDPLTGEPVVILSGELLEPVLPLDLRGLAPAIAAGDVTAVAAAVTSSRAASRLRLVPYNSLGCDNGLLLTFRTDAVYVRQGGALTPAGDVLIGFHQGALVDDGSYQALIHPSLVQRVAGAADFSGLGSRSASSTASSRVIGG